MPDHPHAQRPPDDTPPQTGYPQAVQSDAGCGVGPAAAESPRSTGMRSRSEGGDALDAVCRQMLAETMRPCRELSRYERANDALEARDRNTVLAIWHGAAHRPLKAV